VYKPYNYITLNNLHALLKYGSSDKFGGRLGRVAEKYNALCGCTCTFTTILQAYNGNVDRLMETLTETHVN